MCVLCRFVFTYLCVYVRVFDMCVNVCVCTCVLMRVSNVYTCVDVFEFASLQFSWGTSNGAADSECDV